MRFKKEVFLSFIIIAFCLFHNSLYSENKWAEKTTSALEKNRNRISLNSLNRFGRCVYSQYGEDGILEEVFRRMSITDGFFVEFGAMDGIDISNTRYLLEKGWSGVMIEADHAYYKNLVANYADNPKVMLLKYFVNWNEGQPGLSFDQIRERHFSDKEIDFLSIDIDGGDYYVFKSLQCRPKVIMVENNLYWHPLMKKEVPESVALGNRQQPLDVLISTARDMGYEPVCMTINLILVRRDFYHLFLDVPTDTVTLWRDAFRALSSISASEVIQEWDGIDYKQELLITDDF